MLLYWLRAVPFTNTECSITAICEVIVSPSTTLLSVLFLKITLPSRFLISLMKQGSVQSPSRHLKTLPVSIVW